MRRLGTLEPDEDFTEAIAASNKRFVSSFALFEVGADVIACRRAEMTEEINDGLLEIRAEVAELLAAMDEA